MSHFLFYIFTLYVSFSYLTTLYRYLLMPSRNLTIYITIVIKLSYFFVTHPFDVV